MKQYLCSCNTGAGYPPGKKKGWTEKRLNTERFAVFKAAVPVVGKVGWGNPVGKARHANTPFGSVTPHTDSVISTDNRQTRFGNVGCDGFV